MNRTSEPATPAMSAVDAYARRITAHLTRGSDDLPYDIAERLRAARVQAVDRRKRPAAQAARQTAGMAVAVNARGGTASLGGPGTERGGWWRALISAVPLAALAVGLVVVHLAQDEATAAEIAAVDAALLTDDLPPAAYTDPGFVQYLKVSAQTP